MGGTLSILQAGSLRLNDLLPGLPESTLEVRRLCAEARYFAAEALFQAAIREQVQLLVLTGSVCGQPVAGSRAPWWLQQWFGKLQRAGIAVVLRAVDLPTPPAGLTWPDNVHLVSPQATALIRLANGETVRVNDARGPLDTPGTAHHRVVLSDSLPEPHQISRLGAAYWACQGPTNSVRNAAGEVKAVATGEVQRQSSTASETAGASLIRLRQDVAVEVHPILCEAVRWRTEHLSVTPSSTRDTVLAEMRERHRSWTAPVKLHVVRWVFDLASQANPQHWLNPQFQRELLRSVRADQLPHVWVAGLGIHEVASASQFPAVTLARTLLNQLTGSDNMDLAQVCRLGVDHCPAASRTVTQRHYQDRLALPLDQRLRHDLHEQRAA